MENAEFDERMSLLRAAVPSTSGTFDSAYRRIERKTLEPAANPKRKRLWIPLSASACALALAAIAVSFAFAPRQGSKDVTPAIDLATVPSRSKSFATLPELREFLEGDFAETNEERFAFLYPSSEQPNMGHSFMLSYETSSDGGYISPMVVESYYVYDESLGNLSDESKDTPYCSGSIKAIFAPLSDPKTKEWSFGFGTLGSETAVFDSFANVAEGDRRIGTVYYTSGLIGKEWMGAYLRENLS